MEAGFVFSRLFLTDFVVHIPQGSDVEVVKELVPTLGVVQQAYGARLKGLY